MREQFGYEGKTVVVTGCASGIGAQVAVGAAELGARVIGMDRNEPTADGVRFVRVDLRARDSVVSAVESLPDKLDALFNCAGVSDGSGLGADGVFTINFVAMRELTEQLIPRLIRGAAVASVASLGALNYRENWDRVREVLGRDSWDALIAWVADNADYLVPGRTYAFSKECVIGYTIMQAARFASAGVRINTIAPSPTATPFLDDTKKMKGSEEFLAAFPHLLGRAASAQEQAGPLLFLNSSAASYLTGQVLWTDGGYTAGVASGAIDAVMGERVREDGRPVGPLGVA
jgi:NAD(P)-dependent dehydrogenase (short-subunit alcohol dehydrogenase family)